MTRARTGPAAKATAKAKGHASRSRRLQLRRANARQQMRKDAARSLSALATELDLERVQMGLGRLVASEPTVDRLIRVLEPRCQTDVLAQRLRHAVELWNDNGGALSQPTTGAGSDPVSIACGEDDDSGVQFTPRHKVLQTGYILKSKAFMLTFNSDTIDRATWAAFEHWVKQNRQELGARLGCVCRAVHARRGHSSWTAVSPPLLPLLDRRRRSLPQEPG